jgi:serine phosphatase RsbU (regulator of sigma subunit)/PAS domain-containing protein
MATTDRRPVMEPESALGFLAQASGVLARSLNLERTVAEVASLAVPDVADWCAVDMVEDDGSLRQITSVHSDPEQEMLLLELRRRYRAEKGSTAGAAYAISTGEPILEEDVSGAAEIALEDSEREMYTRLGPRSYMIVPLTARGRTIGALTMLSTREGRHYTDADLDFAQHLARRFALAIDNARLYDEAEGARAMLDTLFSAVPVGIAFLDRELNCLRANDALTTFAPSPGGGCAGHALPDLLQGMDSDIEERARDVLAGGAPLLDHEVDSGGRHWLVSLTPIPAPDGGVSGLGLVAIDVTERRVLLERERAAARRAGFLARAGEVLESSLDYQITLANIARIAVPEIADWCTVHMRDDSGEIRLVAVAHGDPERERRAWEVGRNQAIDPSGTAGPAAVLASGSTEVHTEIAPDALDALNASPERAEVLRGLGLRSAVVAPLRAHGRTVGTITCALAESERQLTADDVAAIEELARRAGLAVDNARLYTERSRIAHALQAELLPTRLPAIPGASVAVRYRAAGEFNEVGGDFYDVFERGDGNWAIVIGDVSGKGAEAAAVTALARHTLRTASLQPVSPTQLLVTLNDALRDQRAGTEFCTVCVGRLQRTGEGPATLRLALGGHPPALVLRADGSVEPHGEPGTLIGVFADPQLSEVDATLRAGDLLLLYTDGVTEAGEVGSEIGEEGLKRLLSQLAGRTAEEVVAAVEHAAVAIQEGNPRDDIALVAVRIEE